MTTPTHSHKPWSDKGVQINGMHIPDGRCLAVPSSSIKDSPCLRYSGTKAPRSKVRLIWKTLHGLMGSVVNVAMAMIHGLNYGRQLKRYECCKYGHQANFIAETIMQATKLPLTTWT